jgi:hypothetical protein
MVTKRFACGSAVFNGCIYVAGGYNTSEEYLSSVECFDPRTEQWREAAAMSSRRTGVCDHFRFHFDDVITV